MIGAVYVITDSSASMDIIDQAHAASRGGAWAIQLRDKDAPEDVFCSIGRSLMTYLRPRGVKLFINDRIQAAIEIGADGLHIGQSDGEPNIVRGRIGPDMMLGLSVESFAQCLVLPRNGIDYIGVGPIRATTTKPNHAKPIGMEGLRRVVQAAPCPVIAIGGLGHGDALAVRNAGANGMAIVSAVSSASDPEASTRALLNEWNSL